MKAETLLPLGKLDPGLRAPDVALAFDRVPSEAQQAENAGYHALLMEETKDDPFQVLALAASATSGIHVGTSVAIAFARSPYVTAQAAWTLQKMSGGRFELGLGTQVSAHIRRRFGLAWHAPGPWMRDYVQAVRAIWKSWQDETPLNFESEHYNLNLNVPLFTPAPIESPDIPIQIAAVNPYMSRVAAEVADGVRFHPVCSPRYIEEVLVPAMAPWRTEDFEVCLKPLIATAPNEEILELRTRITRQRLAFYISTPAYARAFSIYGLADLCTEMAQLSRTQRWDEMEQLVDDELLHKCVVVALYDDLADTLKARYGHLIDRVEVSIPIDTREDSQVLADIVARLNKDAR